MELYWKAVFLALAAAVIGVQLNRTEKDMGMLLSLAAAVLLAGVGVGFLQPVFDLLYRLENLADLRGDFLKILLKALAVGLTAEIAGMVCTDAGNASLGKILNMLASAVILWLSLPLFSAMIDLLQQLVGDV